MRKLCFLFVAMLAMILPAIAQDAAVGKEYDITIEKEDNNQYTGAYGQTQIGSVVFMVPDAKKTEKYHVKVTDIRKNQYTSAMQASCDFTQTGGGDRKGTCIAAP